MSFPADQSAFIAPPLLRPEAFNVENERAQDTRGNAPLCVRQKPTGELEAGQLAEGSA